MNILRFLAAATFAFAAAAHAQGTAPAASGASTSAGLTDAEVRKIDRAQGKLTLRHGPIAHLDMAAMTMVFKVAAPTMLDGLKDGDKVRFRVERVGGALVVTAIEVAAP